MRRWQHAIRTDDPLFGATEDDLRRISVPTAILGAAEDTGHPRRAIHTRRRADPRRGISRGSGISGGVAGPAATEPGQLRAARGAPAPHPRLAGEGRRPTAGSSLRPGLTFGIALDFGSKLRPLRAQLERQSALLEPAEAAGFEIVAAGETARPAPFTCPTRCVALAALAQRTHMRLCTGIALLPAWPVWRLALDAAELDQLSGGRLILGVGLGTPALQSRRLARSTP